MAVEPKTPDAKSTGKVTVACKLPVGHELVLFDHQPNTENVNLTSVQVGEPVNIAGANAPDAVYGWGFTDGVDAAFFAEWMKQNKRLAFVRKGMIFAEDTPAKARDKAREHLLLPTGFEGIDPEKPPGGVLVDNYEGRPKQ